MKQNYNIASKNSRKFTRLKPEMYCGDTAYPNQTILEYFANSLDEHVIGNGLEMWIKLSKDGSIYLRDMGQGIPVDQFYMEAEEEDIIKIKEGKIADWKTDDVGTYHIKTDKSTLERSFSVINSSGKYDEEGVYNGTSLGAFGVGAKLGTFLSHKLIVKSIRNGEFEKLVFVEGILESRETGKSENIHSGVEIWYAPSEEFFGTIYVEENSLLSIIRESCCLCPNFTVHYENENTGTIKDIHCPKGIEEILDPLKDKEIIKNRINVYYEKAAEKRKMQMSITYTKDYSSKIVPYVNYGLTVNGNHITAVKECITRIFNKFARERGLIKDDEKNLTGDQIQEGMVCVFNLISPNIKYDAQVKSTVTSRDLAPFINESISNTLNYWLKANEKDAIKIINKAILARKALDAARKAKEKVRNDDKSKQKNAISHIEKLSDCQSKNPEECEVYIVEGDSAGGSAKVGRDRRFQAILPLRGKILNVKKASDDKIKQNAEIKTMLNAFGCGIGDDFDISKLRYHKIVILSDADVDGKHIVTLFLTFIYTYMPQLITNGNIYCAVPPLFSIKYDSGNKDTIYLKDEAALEKFKAENPNGRYTISRFKGLGEMSAEQLWETTLNPETRTLEQVTMENFEQAETVFDDLMGIEVEPRKQFIMKNCHLADFDI